MKTKLLIAMTLVALTICACGGSSNPTQNIGLSTPVRKPSIPTRETVLIPTPTLQYGRYVKLQGPSYEVQMFGGDAGHIDDIIIKTFPNNTRCVEITARSFDIGLSSPVKYGYLECANSKGWVNANWYH